MAPKIHTPVEGFTGEVAGVHFANGEGETESPAAIAYFERRGYTVEAGDAGKELTPKQKLQTEAKELGLDESGTAEELKARIAEHKEKTTQDPGKGDGGDAGKEQG